jgi:hypothetical protein
MRCCLVIVFAVMIASANLTPGEQTPPPTAGCADLDLVEYTAPQSELFKRIVITQDVPPLQELAKLKAEFSPLGTARFFLSKPDFTKPGPWTTTVYVGGNTARPLTVAVRFSDHASYGVKAQWISEKLIHFNVPWGRIVATDLILNLETRDLLYAEEANYGSFLRPCAEKRATVRQ